MGATEILSKFIVNTKYEDLPPEVIQSVKNAILDALGCGIAGSILEKENLKPILALVKKLEGRKESTIIVDGFLMQL